MDIMEQIEVSEASHTVRLAVLGIISVLIILSNVLCLVVLRRATSGIKTVTRMFLTSLTLADLGIGILAIPLKMLIVVVEDTTLQQLLCVADIFSHGLFTLASIESVIGIAIERYLAIEVPFWHRCNVTKKRVYVAIFCIWLTSLAPAICGGTIAVNGGFSRDKYGWCTHTAGYGSEFTVWIDFVVYTALPFVIIICIYIRIVILVRRHLARRDNVSNKLFIVEDGIARRSANKLRKAASLAKHSKSLYTFLVVVCSFMLIYLPTGVVSVLQITGTFVPNVIVDTSRFAFFCNGWVNNVVYAMRHDVFRKTAQSMVSDLRQCSSRKTRKQRT